jgi:ATP synthase protein I
VLRGPALRADERKSGPEPSPDREPPTKAYNALSVGSLGLEMGLAVLVGWWIGQWLDGRFATGPYLMLLFLGFGIAAAFKALFRAARQTKRAAVESDGVERHREGSR